MHERDSQRNEHITFWDRLKLIVHAENVYALSEEAVAMAATKGIPDPKNRNSNMLDVLGNMLDEYIVSLKGIIEKTNGTPVNVNVPHQEKTISGRIVSLEGIGLSFSKDFLLYGLAVIADPRGREDFIAVTIDPETRTTTLLNDHLNPVNKGKPGIKVAMNALARRMNPTVSHGK